MLHNSKTPMSHMMQVLPKIKQGHCEENHILALTVRSGYSKDMRDRMAIFRGTQSSWPYTGKDPNAAIPNPTPNEQKGQAMVRLFADDESGYRVCTMPSPTEPWMYSKKQYDTAIVHQADVSKVAATCVAPATTCVAPPRAPANNSLARFAELAKVRQRSV